jgi:hypothetical protein
VVFVSYSVILNIVNNLGNKPSRGYLPQSGSSSRGWCWQRSTVGVYQSRVLQWVRTTRQSESNLWPGIWHSVTSPRWRNGRGSVNFVFTSWYRNAKARQLLTSYVFFCDFVWLPFRKADWFIRGFRAQRLRISIVGFLYQYRHLDKLYMIKDVGFSNLV